MAQLLTKSIVFFFFEIAKKFLEKKVAFFINFISEYGQKMFGKLPKVVLYFHGTVLQVIAYGNRSATGCHLVFR